MQNFIYTHFTIFLLVGLFSASLTLAAPSSADACSLIQYLNSVWPDPQGTDVGTNAEFWLDGSLLEAQEATLQPEGGDPINLTIRDLADEFYGQSVVVLRPETSLQANTTYTVSITFQNSFPQLPEIEGLTLTQADDGSGPAQLTWSFTTGAFPADGIDGKALEEITWIRTLFTNPTENSCTGLNETSDRSYLNALLTDDLVPSPVLYTFETLDARGNRVGAGQRIYASSGFEDEDPRISLGHFSAAWIEDGLCARWSARDAYGHEIESDILCSPDACTETPDNRSPFSNENEALAFGTTTCPDTEPEPQNPDTEEPTPQPPSSNTAEGSDEDGGCSTALRNTAPNPLSLLSLFGCALFCALRRRATP